MSLVTMREILPYAEEKKIAIPAFNIDTMEITQAILETVEEENCPAIIAVGQAAIKDGKLESLAATVRTLAKDMKTPVVLHRAILGSLDRFMAYLIEETKGRFPTWLAPTQVKVLPVSEKTLDYAKDVTAKLQAAGVRVVLDESNEKIGYKIRQAQQVDRVPYMLVLGAKEVESNNISVRDRKGETTTMDLDAFINQVVDEIKTRKNNG